MDIINKKKTRNQVCLDLKIAQSTLVQWIKTKDKIITEYQDDGTTSKTKRVRAIEQPEIDKALTEWFSFFWVIF